VTDMELAPFPAIDNPPLRQGDALTIITDGRELEARVQIASPNGRSLVLVFDGLVGGWLSAMPVFQADDGSWAAIDGLPMTLQRIP